MFRTEGYFEGTKSEWKKSWQIALEIMLAGVLVILFVSEFVGMIVVMMGLSRFGESYFSGTGSMGLSTGKKPVTFCNVKQH